MGAASERERLATGNENDRQESRLAIPASQVRHQLGVAVE